MLSTFFGTKIKTSSAFDDKGNRLVVSLIKVDPMTVTQIKSEDKDGYWSVQCAVSNKSHKSLSKPLKSHLKGAKLDKAPRFLREIKLSKEPELKLGEKILVSDVFTKGDQVKVTGVTKGRGFAGVIKRWGFHGGPRTHGQSDRERAIGSIGQRTDPGRVWKGKKMPGHYGTDTQTVRGLKVLDINEKTQQLMISGTVPGHIKSLLKITKTGTSKKPVALYQKNKEPKKDKKTTEKKPKPNQEPKKPASTAKQGK